MMNVANRGCIRRLSRKALAAARTRNIVAVLAIALTSILFTSLFTIAAALSASTEQYNFRIAGGDVHASVKNITWEQVEELRGDPALAHAGARLFLGYPTDPPFNKTHVEVSYMEPEEAPHYFCTPATGALPAEGTDEAACDQTGAGSAGRGSPDRRAVHAGLFYRQRDRPAHPRQPYLHPQRLVGARPRQHRQPGAGAPLRR